MTTLAKRLDKHFAACTAAAAGAALLGGAQQAEAAIVYSGAVNIPVPNTFGGVYLNMVTGQTAAAAAGAVGHDINPYYAGSRLFEQNNSAGVGIMATGPAGPASQAFNLANGAAVVAPFFPGFPINTTANFPPGVPGFIGIRFLRESDNLQLNGWVRLTPGNGGDGTIVDWAYEDTGGAITAGAGANPCTQPLPFCNADVAPVGGNLLVNVDDLLAVINTWGQTQVPPGTGPRPQGDCAPLPNGNCLVDVDDLLAVINAWGNCPVPTGACCAANGTCSVQTAADCATAGGNYQGNGVTCASVVCPVLPANDNCSGAIAVFNGQTNIDNTNATTSAGIPGGACIFGGGSNVAKDLWYSYTATCTGRLTIDTCATGGVVTDTTLQLFTGTCGALTEVACDDDSCGDVDDLLSAIIDFNVTAGQTFFIRVGSWNGNPFGGAGPMILTIGCVVPSDDFCGDATAVGALPATIVGNLSAATADGAPVCNAVSSGIGRWYTLTAGANQQLTASICDSAFGLWDGAISVYCGASCANLFCVAADAGDGACGGTSSQPFVPNPVTWCAAAGQKYWILVHSVGGDFSAGGAFELDVTAGAACVPTVVCGSTNDECAGATTVNLGANAGDNTLATTSAGIPGGACAFAGVSNFTRDVWFKHTPAATGNLTVDICNNPGTVTDSVISILSGPCGALVEVGCDDDACAAPALASTLTVPVTAGQQVFIRVGSWNTSVAGTFTLNLTVPAPPCSIVCPGGAVAEGEACLTVLPDNTNGGCNSTPTVYGAITPNGPMICGTASTFLNGTAQTRDTDWYRFSVPVAANYRIELNAEFTAASGFVTTTNNFPPGVVCTGTAIVGGAFQIVTTPAQACTVVTSAPVNLPAGQYVLFVGPSVFTGFPCGGSNDYQVRVLTP